MAAASAPPGSPLGVLGGICYGRAAVSRRAIPLFPTTLRAGVRSGARAGGSLLVLLALSPVPGCGDGDLATAADGGAGESGHGGSPGAAGSTPGEVGGRAGASGGAAEGSCGDGVVDDGESCDGSVALKASCQSLGFAAGEARCREDCSGYDSSACESAAAIAVGDRHACYLSPAGAVRCWGDNSFGQLGQGDHRARGDQPGELGGQLVPVDLGTERRAVAIAAGLTHTCALLDGGALKCWGAAHAGQLGLGDTEARGDEPGEMGDALPIVELGEGARVVSVTAGYLNTCVSLETDEIKCWGDNQFGQLGLGDTEARGDEAAEVGEVLPTVDLGGTAAVAVLQIGFGSVCALLRDGRVKCWGANSHGELGLGDTEARGDEPGEMGDALPSVELGREFEVRSLGGGMWHRCAVGYAGEVKCWGYNVLGQLGLGDREARGDQPGEMGDALPAVALPAGTGVREVAAGSVFTCARSEQDRVYCWGGNGEGSIGLPGVRQIGVAPGELGAEMPSLDLGENLVARQLVARTGTACVLFGRRSGEDGPDAQDELAGVKCWGANSAGQLGLGDTAPRGIEPGSMGDALPFVDLP